MALNLAKFKTDLGTALKEAAALNDKDNVAKDTALQNIAGPRPAPARVPCPDFFELWERETLRGPDLGR